MKLRFSAFVLCLFLLSPAYATPQQNATSDEAQQALQLVLQVDESREGKISHGYFSVYENRAAQTGRILKLDIVILHALSATPEPDPIFFLVGGPGQGAATVWRGFERSWMRQNRDIVLVNQRGTGGSNRLQLPRMESRSDLQSYLDPTINPDHIDQAIESLSEKADLRMYSTPLAMDDLNDIRQALHYDKINLIGGSYGTRAALVYIRQHGDTVRTAILNGVAPIEFINPLYHAQAAQQALDKIFEEVESNESYREAFPGLREKFAEVQARFRHGPIDVEIKDPESGEAVTIQLSGEAFASSLRFQMYYMDTTRQVPFRIEQAHAGDFRPFVVNAISRNRALEDSIAMGMLLSVTAAEDVARIDPALIAELTDGTFMGDGRVRRQIEACRNWPKSELPDDYGDPVSSAVPVLILSGTIDPVTPPVWGEVVAKNFPNSVHVIAPAAHGVAGPCIVTIQRAFLDAGSVEGLDTSCVDSMQLPPLVLPATSLQRK